MPLLDFDFETWRDTKGYECVPDRLGLDTIIRRKGGRLEKTKPFSYHPTLYKQFADLPDDPVAYCKFVNTFGPITYKHQDPAGRTIDKNLNKAAEKLGESFGLLRQKTELMHHIISGWLEDPAEWMPFGENSPHMRFIAQLGRRPDGGRTLRFLPFTLFEAMLLQLCQAISSDRTIRACAWCNGWFEIGAKSKRSSARFCSDRCRTRFHNDRRLKGAHS